LDTTAAKLRHSVLVYAVRRNPYPDEQFYNVGKLSTVLVFLAAPNSNTCIRCNAAASFLQGGKATADIPV